MLAAHARLALTYERATEIAAAELREQSSEWLGTDALLATIREHLDERRPFSFIRLGDGEARFLVAARPDLRARSSPRRKPAPSARWSGTTGSESLLLPPTPPRSRHLPRTTSPPCATPT